MGTATASPEDRPPTSVGDPPASLSEAEVARPRRTWLIGEIADLTGVTRRALRHYDELGLLVPSARTDSDYRVYDEADLQRLLQVQNLKSLGLRLPEIAAALADASTDATASLVLHREALERRIEQERRLAERLGLLAGQSERSWQDVLAAIALSQRLASPDPVVRLRAALESPGTPADLFGALVAEAEPAVQEVLLWALAQRPAAVATALEHLDHPDAHHRWLMARLLGELGDPVAAAPLLGLLDDPDPAVGGGAGAAPSPSRPSSGCSPSRPCPNRYSPTRWHASGRPPWRRSWRRCELAPRPSGSGPPTCWDASARSPQRIRWLPRSPTRTPPSGWQRHWRWAPSANRDGRRWQPSQPTRSWVRWRAGCSDPTTSTGQRGASPTEHRG
jgi:DNA-binding transcriptional MerR regulator